MRTYLASLPRWALALISGLPFGTLEIRAATLRLAEHQLGQMLRWRTTIIICFAVVLVGQWYWPKRLRSRIELLSGTASTKDS